MQRERANSVTAKDNNPKAKQENRAGPHKKVGPAHKVVPAKKAAPKKPQKAAPKKAQKVQKPQPQPQYVSPELWYSHSRPSPPTNNKRKEPTEPAPKKEPATKKRKTEPEVPSIHDLEGVTDFETANDGKNVFVGNLNKNVTEEEIREFFDGTLRPYDSF